MLKNQSKLHFIDLFCGPGGLSKGLEKAGFSSLIAIDNDPDACDTYQLNHPETKVLCEDITKLDIKTVKSIIGNKKVTLLCGGSPCQAFSTIGLRNPSDLRSKLFFEFIDYAIALEPDYLVFENVKGILSIENGKLIKKIYKLFESIGYTLNHKIMDCSQLEMCQKRERVIFIGSRFGKVDFNSPYGQPKNLIDIIGDISNNSTLPNHQYIQPYKLDLDRIKYIPEGKFFRNNRPSGLKNKIFPYEKLYLKDGEGKTQKYFKLSRFSTTPTVLTNWYSIRYVAHYKNRPFTAREVARIQGFDDNYIFSGQLQSVYKQIGNAVPPPLGFYVGEILTESINFNLHIHNKNRTYTQPTI